MQVTVGELHDAVSALTQIINRPRNIPQTVKFRLAKLHTHLAPFYKNNVKAPLDALIQQYGEEQIDERGNPKGWGVTEQSPKYADFQKALDEERQKTVDVGNIRPITWQSFGEAPTGGIEANEIIYLGPFVTQPEDELPAEERETNP